LRGPAELHIRIGSGCIRVFVTPCAESAAGFVHCPEGGAWRDRVGLNDRQFRLRPSTPRSFPLDDVKDLRWLPIPINA
jgi:hypothetical protein